MGATGLKSPNNKVAVSGFALWSVYTAVLSGHPISTQALRRQKLGTASGGSSVSFQF